MIWAGNFGDASMAQWHAVLVNGVPETIYVNGDQHFSTSPTLDPYGTFVPDDYQPGGTQADLITRVANSIANLFASDAQPGSQFANNGGHMDMGPVAQSASFVGGNDVLVTFAMDPTPGAGSFSALSSLASLGSGWTLNSNTDPTQIDNYAVSAEVWSTNQIMLTFANPVSLSDTLFYEGIGDGHITFIDYWDHILDPGDNPGYTEWNGQGAAIYDSLGLPIQVNAFGLPLNGNSVEVATEPTGMGLLGFGAGLPASTAEISRGPAQPTVPQRFDFSAASGNSTLPGGGLLSPALMASGNGKGIPESILKELPIISSIPENGPRFGQVYTDVPDYPLPGIASGASVPMTSPNLMFADPFTHSFTAAV